MINLRDYQKMAIQEFNDNNGIGILDMATGTGKTLTSLATSQSYYKKEDRQFLIIIVPFLHLIDQWGKDLQLIGVDSYHEIAHSKKVWKPKLSELVWDYNNGFRNRVTIIGSYASMFSADFQEEIAKIRDNSFLIADECHYLGSPQFEKNSFSHCQYRMGLSATPRRWWDETGSQRIVELFGKVVYQFTMQEAISKGFLTQYTYEPVVVNLTEDEEEQYDNLSYKIRNLMLKKKRNSDDEELLQRYLLSRATLLQKAENKKAVFYEMIQEQEDKKHTLVYCAKGQVDEIVKGLSEMGIRVHRFNSEIKSTDREGILQRFDRGEIEVLVAIKCLDEGVDVPSTQTAYFLASTSNPREFIQRRGRVLRLFKGKVLSRIIDFIVLQDDPSGNYGIAKSIATKELPRFSEFSEYAINKYKARAKMQGYLSPLELDYLMDIMPWEMYEQMMKEDEKYESTGRR